MGVPILVKSIFILNQPYIFGILSLYCNGQSLTHPIVNIWEELWNSMISQFELLYLVSKILFEGIGNQGKHIEIFLFILTF